MDEIAAPNDANRTGRDLLLRPVVGDLIVLDQRTVAVLADVTATALRWL
jgi:hypothetical protein